MGKITGDVEM